MFGELCEFGDSCIHTMYIECFNVHVKCSLNSNDNAGERFINIQFKMNINYVINKSKDTRRSWIRSSKLIRNQP